MKYSVGPDRGETLSLFLLHVLALLFVDALKLLLAWLSLLFG